MSPFPAIPTGTITFKDGSKVLATVPLSQVSQAFLNIATLATGRHTITATYSGDGNYLGSVSTAVVVVVGPVTTQTRARISAATSSFGQSVTLSASVNATADALLGVAHLPMATGMVTFWDGMTEIGSAMLNADGVATLSIASLMAGRHAIVADYGGDPIFAISKSAAVILQVNRHTQTPTVQVSDPGGTYDGQPFAANATITGISGTPGSTLEGIGLTLDYKELNANGASWPTWAPLPERRGELPGDCLLRGQHRLRQGHRADAVHDQPRVVYAIGSGQRSGRHLRLVPAYAATATVTGTNGIPGTTLEGVGLTLAYYQVFPNGAEDSLVSVPNYAGNFLVVATFPGSTDYTSASSQAVPFTIGQAAPTFQINCARGASSTASP